MSAGPGEFVVGNPVTGEHHRVALDRGAHPAVQVFDHRAADPVLAVDADQPASGKHRPLHKQPAGHPERRVGFGSRIGAHHCDCGATGFAQCQHRRPADQFGSDDECATTNAGLMQMNQVLQLPGGVHPVGSIARDEPGWARPFARAGSEHDRVGRDGLHPAR